MEHTTLAVPSFSLITPVVVVAVVNVCIARGTHPSFDLYGEPVWCVEGTFPLLYLFIDIYLSKVSLLHCLQGRKRKSLIVKLNIHIDVDIHV